MASTSMQMQKLADHKHGFIFFRDRLNNVLQLRDPLVNIVVMLDVIAEWQDSDVTTKLIKGFESQNDQKYTSIISTLKLLNNLINKNGRSNSGMNRTIKGETVTINKVYIGKEHNLNLLPVSFWILKENKESKSEEEIEIEDEIKSYVNSNAVEIISILNRLIAIC